MKLIHRPISILSGKRGIKTLKNMRPRSSANEEVPGVSVKDFSMAANSLMAIEEYKLLMQQPEPDILHGAVLIARHRYPDIQLEDITDMLDDLAEQVKAALPDSPYPLRVLGAISEYLYNNRGFQGNSKSYYDPDNSCINRVLESRVGIPITLSLVYMETARRCGFELYGVNIPGHFLLTPANPDLEFFIDAFDGGSIAFLEDAEAMLEKIYGQKVKLDPSFLQKSEQIPPRTFLARMLNNLKGLYAAKKNYTGAYTINQYLRATRPGDLDEIKEAGFILWHLERYQESAVMLKEFLERAPMDDAAPKVRRLLRALGQYDDGSDIFL